MHDYSCVAHFSTTVLTHSVRILLLLSKLLHLPHCALALQGAGIVSAGTVATAITFIAGSTFRSNTGATNVSNTTLIPQASPPLLVLLLHKLLLTARCCLLYQP
jgi:hypothetical protein